MFRNIVRIALLATLCTTAHAQTVAGKDGMLTDPAGRALYTFDKDSAGKSNCYDKCAALWPPFAAPAGAAAGGDYSTVARDDGSQQWAFRGKPLYYFAADAEPGQTTGDGRNGVWHLLRAADK